mmetsp:Transcript_23018/g.66733  ORF Transcript_23018/g.66733 Transcript_23018/m.66733 type:complete len:520 (-) Transcript_23018:1763-3322(-)
MSSTSLRATSASLEAFVTLSATPVICSMAFKLGLNLRSSTRKRSSSARYSSSKSLAAGPTEAACFSWGKPRKSTVTFAAASAATAAPPWVGALANWLGASAKSWSASLPPCKSGTSTSSSTLCRNKSARASRNERSSASKSLRRLSKAMSSCFCSLASCRSLESAFSLWRSASKLARTLSSQACTSALSASPLFASSFSFRSTSTISFSNFGRSSSSKTRGFCSFNVSSNIDVSARMFRSCLIKVEYRAPDASFSLRHSRSTFCTSATPMARLSSAKWPFTRSAMLRSSSRCSSLKRASSAAKDAACGLTCSRAARTLACSPPFSASCSWHQRNLAPASTDFASKRRTSSCNVAMSAPVADSSRCSSPRRRSMASKRLRVESNSERSKRVAPSAAASEFTDKFPFLAMASPAKVTTLQLNPAARTSPNANRRPSAMVSATTTPPRTNSNARAKRSSNATQFMANRAARALLTISPRRGSREATRKSASGKKVMGASIRSFKYLTHARAVSEFSTMTAST